MLVNERIPAGTIFRIARTEDTDGKKQKVLRVYCAMKQYRHHVLAVGKGGSRRCITHAELFQHGIVTQRINEVPGWMQKKWKEAGTTGEETRNDDKDT